MSNLDIARSAADALLDDMELINEAPEGEQEVAPDASVEVEETEAPSYLADRSGLDFLNEPDEEEPEDLEPPSFDEPELEEPNWDDDEEKQKLKRDTAKLQKQLDWERSQRIRLSLKDVRAEAERRFPLADLDDIKADSRRSYLKQASASQDRMEKKLKPFLEATARLRDEVITETRQEERRRAETAWGRPTTSSGMPVDPAASQEAIANTMPNNPKRKGPDEYIRERARNLNIFGVAGGE